jgi:hypothetical protein
MSRFGLGFNAGAPVDTGSGTASLSGSTSRDGTITATFNNDDPDGAASGISYLDTRCGDHHHWCHQPELYAGRCGRWHDRQVHDLLYGRQGVCGQLHHGELRDDHATVYNRSVSYRRRLQGAILVPTLPSRQSASAPLTRTGTSLLAFQFRAEATSLRASPSEEFLRQRL